MTSGLHSEPDIAAVGRYVSKVPILLQKSFWGDERKFFRAADAFYARRREGPYRFIQNRPRTFVAALNSDAAAEKSKNQLSRDFSGRSIFDFCNSSFAAFAAISS